jgi:hypothetical protein
LDYECETVLIRWLLIYDGKDCKMMVPHLSEADHAVLREMEVDQRFVNRNLTVIFIALGTFSLGIVGLIIFAIKNLI